MQITEWTEIKNRLLGDRAIMQLVSGENITACKFNIRDPGELPPHSHANEQISFVLKGAMVLKAGGEEKFLSPGAVCVIPPNIEHSATIIETPFESIDVFSPARKDFLAQLKSRPKSQPQTVA